MAVSNGCVRLCHEGLEKGETVDTVMSHTELFLSTSQPEIDRRLQVCPTAHLRPRSMRRQAVPLHKSRKTRTDKSSFAALA